MWLCQGSWAPSGGLGRQVGTTQASGLGCGSAIWKKRGESFSDGRDVGWRVETRLAASGCRDRSKGRELLTSDQDHQLQPQLGASHPGYPCWGSPWVEPLPWLQSEACAARSAPLQSHSCFTKCTFSPSFRCMLWADRAARKAILSILLAEGVLGPAHQTHRHFRLLPGVRWYIPSQELFYFYACISKLGSLSACFSSPFGDGQMWAMKESHARAATLLLCCYITWYST